MCNSCKSVPTTWISQSTGVNFPCEFEFLPSLSFSELFVDFDRGQISVIQRSLLFTFAILTSIFLISFPSVSVVVTCSKVNILGGAFFERENVKKSNQGWSQDRCPFVIISQAHRCSRAKYKLLHLFSHSHTHHLSCSWRQEDPFRMLANQQ